MGEQPNGNRCPGLCMPFFQWTCENEAGGHGCDLQRDFISSRIMALSFYLMLEQNIAIIAIIQKSKGVVTHDKQGL